jgi:adenosylcobinamide kinase/adenosylcobinamide-phosphate guanylyltransferase
MDVVGKRLIFLLGGARSGKSRLAVEWASAHDGRVLFVATADALDDEMRDRIAKHRLGRPAEWATLETSRRAGDAIRAASGNYDTIIVDCLTLLAANALITQPEDCSIATATAVVLEEVESLLKAYTESTATWLVISNEIGMGVVPPMRLGRYFRDALGGANQRVAAASDDVYLLVAGIAWRLKGSAQSGAIL